MADGHFSPCLDRAIVINFAQNRKEENYVRRLFSRDWRDDAFAKKMADCAHDPL